MTKPVCIYHGNCFDGFTAAWAVWKRLWEKQDGYMKHARANMGALVGKNLACWCKIGAPCHADVLLEAAASYAKLNLPTPACEPREDGGAGK